MNTVQSTTEERENPVWSSLAVAERAIDHHLSAACDGDPRAGEIVTVAFSVRKTAELLSHVHPTQESLALLDRKVADLRSLL